LREQPAKRPREPMPPGAAPRVAATLAARGATGILGGQLVPADGARAVHLQPRQDAPVVEHVLARHLSRLVAGRELVQAHRAARGLAHPDRGQRRHGLLPRRRRALPARVRLGHVLQQQVHPRGEEQVAERQAARGQARAFSLSREHGARVRRADEDDPLAARPAFLHLERVEQLHERDIAVLPPRERREVAAAVEAVAAGRGGGEVHEDRRPPRVVALRHRGVRVRLSGRAVSVGGGVSGLPAGGHLFDKAGAAVGALRLLDAHHGTDDQRAHVAVVHRRCAGFLFHLFGSDFLIENYSQEYQNYVRAISYLPNRTNYRERGEDSSVRNSFFFCENFGKKFNTRIRRKHLLALLSLHKAAGTNDLCNFRQKAQQRRVIDHVAEQGTRKSQTKPRIEQYRSS
jgi:hypothetical protein